MYLKEIELVNFQTIESFSSEFDGNVYLVTGENEKGKSTLLKSIAILLSGNKDDVLKNGEDKGFARAVVGDDEHEYQLELKFTKKESKGSFNDYRQKKRYEIRPGFHIAGHF